MSKPTASSPQEPRWIEDNGAWHLLVGNRSVAMIQPNQDPAFSHIRWLSVIDDAELDDGGSIMATAGM